MSTNKFWLDSLLHPGHHDKLKKSLLPPKKFWPIRAFSGAVERWKLLSERNFSSAIKCVSKRINWDFVQLMLTWTVRGKSSRIWSFSGWIFRNWHVFDYDPPHYLISLMISGVIKGQNAPIIILFILLFQYLVKL